MSAELALALLNRAAEVPPVGTDSEDIAEAEPVLVERSASSEVVLKAVRERLEGIWAQPVSMGG